MNETIKVYITDDNKQLIYLIKEYFENHPKIKVIGYAEDGNEAIKDIENMKTADVLLLDLIMPIKDGFYVLEKIKELNVNINVLMFSSFNQTDVFNKASKLGAKYFMLKPFELKELEKRIVEMVDGFEQKIVTQNSDKKNVEVSVSKILHQLGVPSHIKGYKFVREAILEMYANAELVGAVTKVLYPGIAVNHNTTTSRVERAIRHAIEVAWNRGNVDAMEEIFGHSVDIKRSKPTNSEFIATIADKIRLEYNK